MSKVPEVTAGFWVLKIAATTLGETGGDTVTMTLNWGYLAGTALLLAALIALIVMQVLAAKFHPVLYWPTIVASTTFGTTMADFAAKPVADGGLALSRPIASAVIAIFIVLCLLVLPQRPGRSQGMT